MPTIEKALASLSRDEFTPFATGEEVDEVIAGAEPEFHFGLRLANRMLDQFYNSRGE
jgi:hypothetical protein